MHARIRDVRAWLTLRQSMANFLDHIPSSRRFARKIDRMKAKALVSGSEGKEADQSGPTGPRRLQGVFTPFLVALTCLSALPAQGAQPWPTTRFEVFVGTPYTGPEKDSNGNLINVLALESEDVDDRPHPEAIEDAERAFFEAAEWYRKRGFPPPNLAPLVDTDEGRKYRVYLCKNRGGAFKCGLQSDGTTAAAAYVPRCDTDRAGYLYVNWRKAIGNTLGLNEVGYQSVAHELMHAIIDNTPFGTPSSCGTVGGWITEGIPDAISFDLAEEIWVKKNRYEQRTGDGEIMKRYGYRPYIERLPQRENVVSPIQLPTGDVTMATATYTSSSFWRYVADSYPGKWRVLVTEDNKDGALGLLDIPMAARDGWQSEVNWLDDGLSGKFNRSLSSIYSDFVTYFANRVAPLASYQGKPVEASHEHWVRFVFRDCATVDLSNAGKQEILLNLKPLATACVWVEPTTVNGLTQLTFQAESGDYRLLKDIWIGQPDTGLVLNGNVGTSRNEAGVFLASWRDFPQDGSMRTLYVVSNAARKPGDSRPRTVKLTVARSGYDFSGWVGPLPPAPVAPRPRRPSYDKHAPTLAKQARATANMINEQMNLDKESLNPNVSSGVTVNRRPDQPACPEPFRYTACGPQLLITLELMPGTYINPGMATARGGIAAQTFGGLQAMAQTSLFDTETVLKKLEARVDAIDGSAVHIAVPLIDYGFSGSIANAAIGVNMSEGRTWRAIGPPDEQGRTRLTGTVTINEFTPLVLSGSFKAPLAEMEAGEQGPVYRQRQTVTGTFTSVAPWQSDERVEIVPDTTEQMADDIANTLGIPADMVYSMKQKGTMPGGPSAPAGATGSGAPAAGGGVLTGECSCECNMREFADDLCELFCEEEFAACDAL